MRPALKPFLNIYRRDDDVLLGLGPDKTILRKPTPELKSIVTHPPKLNARPTRGPAPGAL